jgi:pyruvate,water dikinase
MAEFPVRWSDPSDVERNWEQDDMHTPFCLAPLAVDYAEVIGRGFNYHFLILDVPIDMRAQAFNGYVYFSYEPLVPGPEQAALFERYLLVKRAHTTDAAAYWDRAVPELRDHYRWITEVPVEDLPADALADAWVEAWVRVERAWSIHFYAIVGPYQVLDDLADLYESVIEDPSPGEALRLVAGTIDELIDVDAGLGRLAELINASPALAAAIDREATRSLEHLATLDGGPAFLAALAPFLETHGHLGQGFDDLGLASWAEEPAGLLAELAQRGKRPVEPAAERAARLEAEAEVLADVVRARLADQPERLAEFERLLALGRRIGPITETHNYWIDRMAQARIRAFSMRVGERLVRDGVIERPDDVLYLHRAEVPDLIRAPEDRRAVVAARRADREHWRTIKPPPSLGRPSTEEPSGRFGGKRLEKDADDIVRGTGASPGVVRGPARVVLGPEQFCLVEPGDIVIAPSSNPSWVPIFAIAGGLIADTGGVLSHAAVVAREFALPAVVGTGDGTRRILDGQIVELDGTTGHVRLR